MVGWSGGGVVGAVMERWREREWCVVGQRSVQVRSGSYRVVEVGESRRREDSEYEETAHRCKVSLSSGEGEHVRARELGNARARPKRRRTEAGW